jgi:hypothetical protein
MVVANFTITLNTVDIEGLPTVTLEDMQGQPIKNWAFKNPCNTTVTGGSSSTECTATTSISTASIAAGTYKVQFKAVAGSYQKIAPLTVIVP